MANWSVSRMSVYTSPFSRPRLPAVNDILPPVLIARLARDDIDGATDRIAPVQGALRAAQHFHALDIGEIPVLADLAAEIDAIHIDTDARIRRDQVILQADAADERIRPTRCGRLKNRSHSGSARTCRYR